MKDGQFIKMHVFDTSSDAWRFMVQGNTKKDRFLCIPRESPCLVEEYYRDFKEYVADPDFCPPRIHVKSDSMGSINGIKNMADGKMYDSKSEYYKAVKAAGCVVVGNEVPRETRKDPIDKHGIDWKKEVAKAVQTLSSKKGKRK